MLSCNKCGFESPDTDQFCRQCGAQIASLPEFASPAGAPNRPAQTAGTGRLPSNIGDAIAGDTMRFYGQPPSGAMPVYYAPAPAMAPSQEKPPSNFFRSMSGFMRGLFFFILIAGLVGATGTAVFWSQEARRERDRRVQSDIRNEARISANRRAESAWEQMEEAIQLAEAATERAAGAGATISISPEKSVDLAKFAYPGAQVESSVVTTGSETLSLTSRNNFETIRSHYEQLCGKPVLQFKNGEIRKLLFQAPTAPVLIRLETTYEESGVKVTLFRAPLRFPQPQ
ncbi:MAG: zinc ribbon domain-containing protein [Blastocatellia bacterium]|nr:zinc ribbon domain-containing protein [Blastocatellia bacterium]